MSHLTADPTALALGAAVGSAAGLYAHRAASRAVAKAPEPGTDGTSARVLPIYALTGLSTVAGLLIGARFGTTAPLPAYLYLAAIAPALAAIDAATRQLPNRIVLPSYPLAAALLGFAAWRARDPVAFGRSLLAGAAVFALLLAIALAAPPRSLGWADVKLGGLLAHFLGYLGWTTAWLGMMTAFTLAAVYVVVRALVKRGGRARVLPLGPALLLGTLIAVVTG